MSIEEAVTRDLERLPEADRQSTLAETALNLARGLDEGYEKGSEQAAVARELKNHMTDLLANATAAEGDRVDDLAAGRAARLAAAAGS